MMRERTKDAWLIAILALGLLAICAVANAQDLTPNLVGGQYHVTPPTAADKQLIGIQVDANGRIILGAGSVLVGAVTALPTNAAATVTAKTVTNSSAAFLAASAATKFLLIKNEDTAATIALNFANGSAALNTAGNITLGPGMSITFDGSFVPTGAITAISSAATSAATVILN